jgi:flavorubredoxin
MYAGVRAAIAQVLDPSRLRHVIVAHFEADECGGMGRFVAEAPQSMLARSAVGAPINPQQWDYAGSVKGMQEGDVIDLGRHRLRFWETPHVHHWDSMMVVEETTASLCPSDLFIQPNDQPSIVRENLGMEMCEFYTASGIFGGADPVLRVVGRVERLAPAWVHPMHGGSRLEDPTVHLQRPALWPASSQRGIAPKIESPSSPTRQPTVLGIGTTQSETALAGYRLGALSMLPELRYRSAVHWSGGSPRNCRLHLTGVRPTCCARPSA